ncbi:C40 family peptidase [Klebsiella sp. WOUb02]|uniref:C40 family peptidase n=1 Tax=Klebsiella sp. WOUb02 TaxID=3161071 RepID=UPI003CEEE2D1
MPIAISKAAASPHQVAISTDYSVDSQRSKIELRPSNNTIHSVKLRILLNQYDKNQQEKTTRTARIASTQGETVVHQMPHSFRYIGLKKDPTAKALVRRGLLKTTLRRNPEYRNFVSAKISFSQASRVIDDVPIRLALSDTHKKRYLRVRQSAINKLMEQLGKPYRWGGASPYSGFDCSGLVYYAYKDLVKAPLPRTANEMFHHRNADSIKQNELEQGDLVFFRIHKGSVDHVGVYIGNNHFIQSPRTGSDIRISKLTDDYWQNHYVGARRVVTPQTIR